MKFTISTQQFNYILSKVSTGVGNNRILPITEFVRVHLQGTRLDITATNSVNFITYIDELKEEGEDGVAIIKADTLIKLVSKTTKENITLTKKADYLEVKGNGVYKVPLYETDEYPSYNFNHHTSQIVADVKQMQSMFKINEASLASEMIVPCLTGFNVGESCITTDGIKMCINEVSVFKETRALITQTLAKLLSCLTEETVQVQKDGSNLLFTTSNIVIFGAELDGVEQYPDIMPILQVDYKNQVTVSNSILTSTLDRLSLFTDDANSNGVRLIFNSTDLWAEDVARKSTEIIPYIESSVEEVTSVVININYLQRLLSVSAESVTLHFMEGSPLKLTQQGLTQILGTLALS